VQSRLNFAATLGVRPPAIFQVIRSSGNQIKGPTFRYWSSSFTDQAELAGARSVQKFAATRS
jgi:hypothetical protein